MVQHCIETNFVYFLDRKFITPVTANCSDHAFYQSFLPPATNPEDAVSIFNHHNLCSDGEYESYQRRCQRFIHRFCDSAQRMCLVYTIQRDQQWPRDFSDPEWLELCSFVKFLRKRDSAQHIMVLTFVLQRVAGEVPPWEQIYDTESHKAFMVYYAEFDNLADVQAILEQVGKIDNHLEGTSRVELHHM
jgi:hypothetical protein